MDSMIEMSPENKSRYQKSFHRLNCLIRKTQGDKVAWITKKNLRKALYKIIDKEGFLNLFRQAGDSEEELVIRITRMDEVSDKIESIIGKSKKKKKRVARR
jgi:hypothetical protein